MTFYSTSNLIPFSKSDKVVGKNISSSALLPGRGFVCCQIFLKQSQKAFLTLFTLNRTFLCLNPLWLRSIIVKSLFLFKSNSWPNQIWSWVDGWLHFRETTPLWDPGSPRITNGFLIIFHHPILCLSLISPMIPETSRELHLNLCDQSRLRSSLSHTCLTALNTLCVHKACMCGDSRYTSAHHKLTLSLPEWPRSAAACTYWIPYLHTFIHRAVKTKKFLISTCIYSFLHTVHACGSGAGAWLAG